MARPADRPLPRTPARRLISAFSSRFVLAVFLLITASAGAAGAACPAELVAVPYPDLDGLEEIVRQELRTAEAELRELQDIEVDAPREKLAAAFGRLGQLYHAYSFFDAAEASYQNACALAPDELRWPYYLGVVRQGIGKLDGAATAFRRALEIHDDLAARVRLGRVLLAQNRGDEARVELERALELDAENPATLAALGELALASGDNARAVELLSAVLERLPAANRLHYPLGIAYRGLGDLEAARAHLRQRGAVGVKVEDPLVDEIERLAAGERLHLQRGQAAFNAGRFADAADAFRRAADADPASARARTNLGTALGQLGRIDEAIAAYREALALEPDNATAHFNLGTLLERRDETADAAAHFRDAVRLRGDDITARLELARLERRLGRLDAALGQAREALRLAPKNEDLHLLRAAVLMALERSTEALEALEEAHELLPRAGLIAHNLARLLAAGPDPESRDGTRALRLARAVYEAVPTVEHAVTVALALAELDQCSAAAEWLSPAIEALSTNGQDARAEELRRERDRYAAAASNCRP